MVVTAPVEAEQQRSYAVSLPVSSPCDVIQVNYGGLDWLLGPTEGARCYDQLLKAPHFMSTVNLFFLFLPECPYTYLGAL